MCDPGDVAAPVSCCFQSESLLPYLFINHSFIHLIRGLSSVLSTRDTVMNERSGNKSCPREAYSVVEVRNLLH